MVARLLFGLQLSNCYCNSELIGVFMLLMWNLRLHRGIDFFSLQPDCRKKHPNIEIHVGNLTHQLTVDYTAVHCGHNKLSEIVIGQALGQNASMCNIQKQKEHTIHTSLSNWGVIFSQTCQSGSKTLYESRMVNYFKETKFEIQAISTFECYFFIFL